LRLSIIVLVFNEEPSIREDILSIKKNILDSFKNSELIIVEDYSPDRSYEICKEFESDKIRILRGEKRLGYRPSLTLGINSSKYENIFFTESGTKYDFQEFLKFSKDYEQGLVYSGYRNPRYDSTSRRFLTLSMNWLSRFIFNNKLKDIDSGYKLMSKSLYKEYYCDNWFFEDFGSAEMLIRMDYNSIRIIEKKISYYQRPDESKQFSILKIIKKSSKLLKNLLTLKKILSK
tara:strand:+ start:180 stop:875 length:696 start_codon:yes stop_codon:yes gene_type:complete